MGPPSSLMICVALAASAPAGAQVPDSLDECDARVRMDPDDHESYQCYWTVARRLQVWKEAAGRLDALLLIDPDNHAARSYLAAIEADRGQDRAEELGRRAAEGFAEDEEPAAEIHTRLMLAFFLGQRGRLDEAETELDRASRVAEEMGDETFLARVLIAAAGMANRREDYGRALRLLQRVERAIFPDGPAELRQLWLNSMGYTAWALGQGGRALACYRREAQLLHEEGDLFREAVPRRNAVFVAGQIGRDRGERLVLAREALAAAEAGGNLSAQSSIHFDLANLTEGAESLAHARMSLRIARGLKTPAGVQNALRALAPRLLELDRDEAFERIDEAIDLAHRAGELSEKVRDLVTRARMHQSLGQENQTRADYLSSLEIIESMRTREPDTEARAMRFSSWGVPYLDLSAHLLSGGSAAAGAQPSFEDLELAFTVMERHRARNLLDHLDAAGATAAVSPSGEDADRHSELLLEIARVQRRLRGDTQTAAERDLVLFELEELERRESILREEIARADPAFAFLHRPDFPSLVELQEALAEDQAMLLYQLATAAPTTRTWVLVATREECRAYDLHDTSGLPEALALFQGLLARRDGSEIPAATRLYRDLLEEALDDLPPGVSRLVVVPDGPLSLLPFDLLLRHSEAGSPAGPAEVAMAPSATAWLRMRRQASAKTGSAVLALVDPAPIGSAGDEDTQAERGVRPAIDAPFPRLRHARSEGRSIVRHLGPGVRVLAGPQAAERFVKGTDIGEFGILHFAAHAVVDDERPERSAILLHPGGEEEDGLLQMREIVSLDLSGQLVVLSSCRSASGPIWGSEGVMGLARAFLVAGAGVVVGSLWALPDEEAAALFDAFYRRLGGGMSVSAALAAAKGERAASGVPPLDWAGVVVLGDGDMTPIPGGRPSAGRVRAMKAIVAGAILLSLGLVAWALLRRVR